MEPCAEHSGVVMCLKTIERDVAEIKDVQRTSSMKLDDIQEKLTSAKLQLETEKIESQWRQKTSIGIWSMVGGATTYILTKVFGKYL
jgi:DNA-directed RNA polymerase alpha subunit